MNKTLSILFKSFALLIIVLCLTIYGYLYLKIYAYIKEAENFDINKIYVPEATKIYDQNDNLVAELGTEKRTLVKYTDISPKMIEALIAIEDARFFQHHGFDTPRIISSIIENLKHKSYKEGASTITQQLVKLSYLTREKTIDRKLREVFLSIELENRLTKEEIIEAYLNRVLFGGRIYGVEKASQYYFHKSAKELNYEEASLLAGIIQSPNRYNPYTNPEATKKRQILVLEALYQHGYITKDELDQGINRPLHELVLDPLIESYDKEITAYLDYVIYELKTKYQLDPLTDYLQVKTHLNLNIQKTIYHTENDETLHPKSNTQSGIVVLETKTGHIKGIGGGRGYQDILSFNLATDARLQPGSTIKPILDYGPAIEYLYYSPAHPFIDEKIFYSTLGSRYVAVENYDHKYKGILSMRESIIDSRNVTAIKAFREVGMDRAYEFASKLGLKIKEPMTEAHAIGGFKYGFTVLEMAASYAAFGNRGIYTEPTTIKEIIKDGQVIKPITNQIQAMREDTAYLMSHMLHDNMINGTAVTANVTNLIIAGKTGQTNFPDEIIAKYNYPHNCVRDSWFIGYTTKYTTAVWLGFTKIMENTFLTPQEAKQALVMFRKVMEEIHQKPHESTEFYRPDNIIEVEIEANTYPLGLPSEYTPLIYRKKELFIKGYEPKNISNYFKPLDTPKNFFAYYDFETEELVFRWDKVNLDFSSEDFYLSERVHGIEKFYDNYKAKTQNEFYQTGELTYLKSSRIANTYAEYCTSTNKLGRLCPITNPKELNTHILLLEELKKTEINNLLKDKKARILSEGELSIIRGYETYNGYHNGLYSNLGNIQYEIKGMRGFEEVILYQGEYREELRVPMTAEEYFQFNAFAISADFSRYKNFLKSSKTITLNPLWN